MAKKKKLSNLRPERPKLKVDEVGPANGVCDEIDKALSVGKPETIVTCNIELSIEEQLLKVAKAMEPFANVQNPCISQGYRMLIKHVIPLTKTGMKLIG